MHGQAKVKTTEEEKERKRKEKERKGKLYRDGMRKVFEKRRKSELDDEALELISDILVSNPDIYTLWNFRKEILLTHKDKSHDDLACVLSNEMHLTEICLRANPKSYCAWHHRLWLLDNLPYADLEKELFLCTKYLKLDERNFHCWDYRRAVVRKLQVPPSEELDYTTVKIEENFSNYSSWHYRSKLLPLVHPDPSALRPVDEPTHLNELELVQAACFTDPYDSSSWFYLRWLLGRPTAGPALVLAFLSSETESQHLVVVFNRPPPRPLSPLAWTPVSHEKLIWLRELVEEEKNKEELSFKLRFSDSDSEEVIEVRGGRRLTRSPVFDPQVSPALSTVLSSSLASSDQLLQLEPHSKWTLLTSIVLMQAIDKKKYRSDILERMSLLIQDDPYRKEYYIDMRSKFIMEEALENLNTDSDEVSLSSLGLSSLHHTHYLAFARSLDLSGNILGRSLPLLSHLYNCEILNLDKNDLTSLKGFPRMPKLKTISLRGNRLCSKESIVDCLHSNQLHEIHISENGMSPQVLKELSQAYNVTFISS